MLEKQYEYKYEGCVKTKFRTNNHIGPRDIVDTPFGRCRLMSICGHEVLRPIKKSDLLTDIVMREQKAALAEREQAEAEFLKREAIKISEQKAELCVAALHDHAKDALIYGTGVGRFVGIDLAAPNTDITELMTNKPGGLVCVSIEDGMELEVFGSLKFGRVENVRFFDNDNRAEIADRDEQGIADDLAAAIPELVKEEPSAGQVFFNALTRPPAALETTLGCITQRGV